MESEREYSLDRLEALTRIQELQDELKQARQMVAEAREAFNDLREMHNVAAPPGLPAPQDAAPSLPSGPMDTPPVKGVASTPRLGLLS